LRIPAPEDDGTKAYFVDVTQTFKEQAPGLASASAATADCNVNLRGDESALRPGCGPITFSTGIYPPGINNADIQALISLDVTGGVHTPLRLAA
jgi:hypothetical protein